MKRIVVTGASGFVGRRLLAALGECGYPARGLVRAAHAGSGEFIGVDYGDAAALAAALRTADCVVHVAGLAHVEPRHLPDAEAAFHEANVGVACNVADSTRSDSQLLELIGGNLARDVPLNDAGGECNQLSKRRNALIVGRRANRRRSNHSKCQNMK